MKAPNKVIERNFRDVQSSVFFSQWTLILSWISASVGTASGLHTRTQFFRAINLQDALSGTALMNTQWTTFCFLGLIFCQDDKTPVLDCYVMYAVERSSLGDRCNRRRPLCVCVCVCVLHVVWMRRPAWFPWCCYPVILWHHQVSSWYHLSRCVAISCCVCLRTGRWDLKFRLLMEHSLPKLDGRVWVITSSLSFDYCYWSWNDGYSWLPS
jgi:hypothetical protein